MKRVRRREELEGGWVGASWRPCRADIDGETMHEISKVKTDRCCDSILSNSNAWQRIKNHDLSIDSTALP